MGLFLYPIREMNLIYTLPIGTVVYIGVLLITGFVSKEDLSFILKIFKKDHTATS